MKAWVSKKDGLKTSSCPSSRLRDVPGLGRVTAVVCAAGTIHQRPTATTSRPLLLAPSESAALGCEPPLPGSSRSHSTPGITASVKSPDCLSALFTSGGPASESREIGRVSFHETWGVAPGQKEPWKAWSGSHAGSPECPFKTPQMPHLLSSYFDIFFESSPNTVFLPCPTLNVWPLAMTDYESDL